MTEPSSPSSRPHLAPRWAGGVVLALLVALAVAAPVSAEHRKLRFGATEGGVTVADVRAMGAARVQVLRKNFSWVGLSGEEEATVGCTNPEIYDWGGESGRQSAEDYDEVVSRASRNGVSLLPVIVGSPRWVAARSTHSPETQSAREMRSYRCFVRALVARYGRNGEYQRIDKQARPITTWQVWNEVNLVSFATERGVDPREYARLVTVTRAEILGEDAAAKIILAGMPELTGSGFSSRRYLNQLYSVPGIKQRFDAVALHPYSSSYRGVEGALIRLRRLLRNVGDARRPVWITEVGWATHGNTFEFLVKGAQGQARQLRKTFRMLERNRKRFKLGTVAWFRWRDQATPAENRGPFDYAGLFREGGGPKRSCRAYVSFTGGRCAPIPDDPPPATPSALDRGAAQVVPSPVE